MSGVGSDHARHRPVPSFPNGSSNDDLQPDRLVAGTPPVAPTGPPEAAALPADDGDRGVLHSGALERRRAHRLGALDATALSRAGSPGACLGDAGGRSAGQSGEGEPGGLPPQPGVLGRRGLVRGAPHGALVGAGGGGGGGAGVGRLLPAAGRRARPRPDVHGGGDGDVGVQHGQRLRRLRSAGGDQPSAVAASRRRRRWRQWRRRRRRTRADHRSARLAGDRRPASRLRHSPARDRPLASVELRRRAAARPAVPRSRGTAGRRRVSGAGVGRPSPRRTRPRPPVSRHQRGSGARAPSRCTRRSWGSRNRIST